MAYTKSVAIDQCYIRINGGVLSSENKVKREDIEPYLMAAIAWAWGIESEERLQRSIRNKRYGVADNTTFDDLRVTQYLTPQYDEKKKEYYVQVGNIPNIGSMFFDIAPIQGTMPIHKIGKRSDLQGLDGIADSFMFAYYLKLKEQDARIYITNFKDGDCQVEVTTNADFSALKDDDIIFAPAGKETLIIDKTVEFFTGQKLIPDDVRVEQRDTKTDK